MRIPEPVEGSSRLARNAVPTRSTDAKAAFSVMAKPVGARCNLACDYCYYLARPAGRPAESAPRRMSPAVLEAFIRQYIQASPGPAVSFVWHGGEPTLAGLDFYRQVVELQQRHLPEGWQCWNNLQTNGTLLDDAWCQFLAEEHFDVGLSLDGTQWLHDSVRMSRHGEGSYRAAREAVARLQDHGLQPDLLCTVTSAIAAEPLTVYRNLRALGTGWIQFIPIVRPSTRPTDGADAVTPDSVSPPAYGQFLCAVFDEWAANDFGLTAVQLFAETLNTLAGGAPGLCWLAPTCGRALVVEADGGVYSCDHFVNNDHKLGNVLTADLGELADSPGQLAFGQAKHDGLPGQCLACPHLALCRGGCPKDRFLVSQDGEPGLNYLCAGLSRFFAWAAPLLRLMVAQTRDGRSPAWLRTHVRTAQLERWQGVGRNDPCPCGSGRKAKSCCWSRRP